MGKEAAGRMRYDYADRDLVLKLLLPESSDPSFMSAVVDGLQRKLDGPEVTIEGGELRVLLKAQDLLEQHLPSAQEAMNWLWNLLNEVLYRLR